MSNAIHVLGVPHTIVNDKYSVCAFTAKMMFFPDVIQPFGWEVIEYSNAGSASNALHHVTVLDADQFCRLSNGSIDADLQNVELKQEFQRTLISKLKAWAQPGDIVCHVWGPNIEACKELPNCHHIESSVGYTANPGLAFRIYESSAWMHWHYGKAGEEDGNNYKWVVPSAFDTEKWLLCEKPGDYVLFLGRVTERKGIETLLEVARRMPDMPFLVYGPGDASRWIHKAPPNVAFKGPVFGDDRIELVRNARCMLMPTVFIEPFGFSGIESQLCGSPLITSSYGAFQETVLDGVTGYMCHTLADWVRAIEMSVSLDRGKIAALARQKYSKEVVGRQYDWIFRQVQDLSGAGWYSEWSRKFNAPGKPVVTSGIRSSKIYLFMPYFGRFPNYFQIYLDSLANNAEFLVVFLLTDIDLSKYRLPRNLISIPMTLEMLRERVSNFLSDEFGITALPEDCIKDVYKLVDFKITYPKLFQSILDEHGVTADDFVGWGDCDLIYGRFSDFLDNMSNFQIIGGFHGHFTAFRNLDSFKNLFKAVENLPKLMLDNTVHITDEIAFRAPLLAFLAKNKYTMFYINRYFCDIVPSCFYGIFRPDHANLTKNFFDAYNPDKNIDYVFYDKRGVLIVRYEDGVERKCIYCHLQKRPMSVELDTVEHGFYIREYSLEQAPAPIVCTVDGKPPA